MTDIEINKLCAEAMGWRKHKLSAITMYNEESGASMPRAAWNPLHDDAQAMTLYKKFPMNIQHAALSSADNWVVESIEISEDNFCAWVADKSLNRAICECVAKMHQNSPRTT